VPTRILPGPTLCYTDRVTKTAKELLERVASWPEEDIEKLEEAARHIEAWRKGEYHATEDELRAIDEAIAELDRGEVASEAQVKAAYAKFHGE
jgi:hypothetical protein